MPDALKRAGRYFDGWFPSGAGTPQEWGEKWAAIRQHARDAGRDPAAITGAVYTTVAVNADPVAANAELDAYLEGYYMQPAALIRQQQYAFAGDLAAVTDWLGQFVANGCTHLSTRFTGTDDRGQMETLVRMRERLS